MSYLNCRHLTTSNYITHDDLHHFVKTRLNLTTFFLTVFKFNCCVGVFTFAAVRLNEQKIKLVLEMSALVNTFRKNALKNLRKIKDKHKRQLLQILHRRNEESTSQKTTQTLDTGSITNKKVGKEVFVEKQGVGVGKSWGTLNILRTDPLIYDGREGIG